MNPVELSPDERARYVGTYRAASGADAPEIVGRVWEENDRLHYRLGTIGERTGVHYHLVPLGNDRFAPGRYQGGRPVAMDPHARFRFVMVGSQAEALEAGTGGEIHFTAQRADPDQLRADTDRVLAERKALRSRTPIDRIILAALEAGGTESARALHRDLLVSRPDSVRFGDPLRDSPLLGILGGRLLREGRTEEAIAVFEMNAEAYPEIPRAHGALADAYGAAGRLEDARQSYERAVRLAEQQGHEDMANYQRKLERLIEQLKERGPAG